MLGIQEMLKVLNERGVRYLLVGGFAGILYGVPRTTLDLDILIDPEPKNVLATIDALENLGLVPDSRDRKRFWGWAEPPSLTTEKSM